eukprot:CAMPEP_0198291958 /NCGR_PEP_ID=MMETSP1449-20131203/9281_1 /TAXON_ID=420275 /ORGANISM="Attheya septentrionalis, Strain CCMP2084" /LENGTH=271 /DNA_ID=CAMNT_0043990645 /DNA_START=111 /DNA_END=926 /DNA_ORIENTATION=-
MNDLALSAGVAAVTGEASLSMADVDVTQVGRNNDTAAEMREGDTKGLGIVETVTYAVCATSFVFAPLAMVVAQASVVNVAMFLAGIIAPYAAYQRALLSRMDTLRQVHNKIRKDVSRLRAQNDKLSQENDNLERETAKVQGMEASLSGIMEKQGSSVGTFIDLVKENKSIQNKINANLEAVVLQDILDVVIRSDKDEDFIIDPEEVNLLIMRLQSSNGIEVEAEKFKELMAKKGYKLSAVLDICRNLMDHSLADSECVIHVNSQGLHPGQI